MKLSIVLGLLVATSAQADLHLYSADCATLFNALNLPAARETFPRPSSSGSMPSPSDSQIKVGRGYEASSPSFLPRPEAACSFEGDVNVSDEGTFTMLLNRRNGEHLWNQLNVEAVSVEMPAWTKSTKFSKSIGRMRLERDVTDGGIIEGTYVLTTAPRR